MSDGMSDSRALNSLAERIEFAAMDLRDALEDAEVGHRGLTVNALDIVNLVLGNSGYVLVKE